MNTGRLGEALRRPVADAARVVTPFGWLLTVFVLVGWPLGRRLGWAELVLAAVLGAVVLLSAIVLTVGRAGTSGVITLAHERVTAGGSVGVTLVLAGSARRRLLPLTVELVVGEGVRRLDVPALAAGAGRREDLTVDTARRGVIAVGPATTVRGDPFGLLRRAAPLATAKELLVHPATVPLRPLAGGLLRDLEGRPTEDVSMSDLAFHALRAYAPGDDRRHIHWRSSARALSMDPDGDLTGGLDLQVRQFNDTRRSHLMIVVDGHPGAYPRADDLELAMSAGASVALRAVRDETVTTVVAGDQLATGNHGRRTLDAFARAAVTALPLAELVARGMRAAPDVTTALLVTGSARAFTELRRAAAWFPPEVAVVAVRVDAAGRTAVSRAGALAVLDLAALPDLPGLLRGSLAPAARS